MTAHRALGGLTLWMCCISAAAPVCAQPADHAMPEHSMDPVEPPVPPPTTQAVDSLPAARPTEVWKLADGETVTLRVRMVRKKIGDTWVKMYAYAGMVPGPVFKVRQGAEITVVLKNETDLDTALHSHGRGKAAVTESRAG